MKEKRTILTRDRGILKRSDVTRGYWIRNTKTDEQIIEVIKRFDLKAQMKELSRCLLCNSLLRKIPNEKIIDRLPKKVIEYQKEFYYCRNCDKVFWKGSHYTKMKGIIEKLKLL